jgi:hypothetical protein
MAVVSPRALCKDTDWDANMTWLFAHMPSTMRFNKASKWPQLFLRRQASKMSTSYGPGPGLSGCRTKMFAFGFYDWNHGILPLLIHNASTLKLINNAPEAVGRLVPEIESYLVWPFAFLRQFILEDAKIPVALMDSYKGFAMTRALAVCFFSASHLFHYWD